MRYWIDGYWIDGWWREEFFLDPEAEPERPAPIPGETSPVSPVVPIPIPVFETDSVPTMIYPSAYRLSNPIIRQDPTSRIHASRSSRIETEESESSVPSRGVRTPTRPTTTIRKHP